jgi:NAD(P)-dependent dehydrogenase (short-subunit alcohol dehydrogenase family)
MANAYLDTMFSLAGRTAVVVGGTGVLGGALAEGLGRAGAFIVVAGRGADRGEARVDAIRAAGGDGTFVSVDATDRESVRALLEAAVHARGKADILVNCAGVNSSVPYFGIPDDDFAKVIDTNLKSTHIGCQVFGATWPSTAAARSSTSAACRPTSRFPACSSTRRRRPRWSTTPRTWPGNWPPRACG